MNHSRSFDVSVILPFGDDEDVIGTAAVRLAEHLRELDLAFEIVAVDEDSGDNSHAVLALLRSEVPELRVVHAGIRGRGFEYGMRRAQGDSVWFIDTVSATHGLAPFARAYRRVASGEIDLVVAKQRFAVAHRSKLLPVAEATRGVGYVYLKRLAKRANLCRLEVDVQVVGSALPIPPAMMRPWMRVVERFSSMRFQFVPRD